MTAQDFERENRLVKLLDEALREFQQGRTLAPDGWQARYADLTDTDAQHLLRVLNHLAAAVQDWTLCLPAAAAAQTPSEAADGATGSYAPGTPSEPGRGVAKEDLPACIGRYRVHGLVGEGGMGRVYRATDPDLNRVVAVKVPLAARCDASFRQRFLQEARAAAAVRHPHVCPIYDVGEHDGLPYVVMAYVAGGTLADLLEGGTPVSPREAVDLVRRVADALAAVHAHGITHRNLKPSNILLDAEGTPHLTDFGLARCEAVTERLTRDGAVVGTPAYMAPEQADADAGRVGPASDLYSLGVILFRMLTGRLPHTGSPLSVLLHKIASQPAPPVRSLAPDVDPGLAAVVDRALAREPSARFPDARAFADALGAWLGAPPGAAGPAKAVARRPALWRRVVLGAAAGLLLVGAGMITWLALGRSPPPSDGAPLTGSLEVTLSDPRGRPRRPRPRIPVQQPGALPARDGDVVHIRARLSRPAHAYVLWVDSSGKVYPCYPWDIGHDDRGWKARWVPGGELPRDEVLCPDDVQGGGLVIDNVAGLETVLLLARSTPLPPGVDLEQLVGRLPRSPDLADPREWAVLPFDRAGRALRQEDGKFRGPVPGRIKEVDAPLQDLLRDRLGEHFEVLTAVRFAHVNEGGAP